MRTESDRTRREEWTKNVRIGRKIANARHSPPRNWRVPVTAEERCPATDGGRQCRKKGAVRYGGKGTPLCKRHYQRAVRNGGTIDSPEKDADA